MKIDKNVYKQLKDLQVKSFTMRSIASDEKVDFNKSHEIRREQDKIYKKMQFYKNFISYTTKKEGI